MLRDLEVVVQAVDNLHVSERSHTADQFAKAKKRWLGGKLLPQEHGSHATHMASAIPCPDSEGSGLKS